jgi:hypothetical protein
MKCGDVKAVLTWRLLRKTLGLDELQLQRPGFPLSIVFDVPAASVILAACARSDLSNSGSAATPSSRESSATMK